MAAELPYTLTRESITVVYKGKPYVVQKGSPHFVSLRKAILDEDWDSVPEHLTVEKSLKEWAKGKVTLKDDHFYFDGAQIPSNINTRIIKMATGGEDPTPLFKFWERLQRNPSKRSVDQLWPFLEHKGIPLTKDGCFLAYKGVKQNFKDAHSGTIDNSPGTVHEMPRNQISDDPQQPCHEGFHVGALAYAGTFSDRVVICEVDPENVVCVPYDESQHKMRVCKYKVTGQHNGSHLSSTTHREDPPDVNEELEREEAENEDDEGEDGFDPVPSELKREASQRKKKKGSEKKKEHKAKKKAGKQLAKTFDKLKKMGMPELMQESLDTLRDYAGKGLKIVGASKVPGGKTALVAVIIKARE